MDPVCAFGHLAPGGVDCSGNGICVNITGRSTCQCNEGWAGTGDFTFVAEDCDQLLVAIRILWGIASFNYSLLCIAAVVNVRDAILQKCKRDTLFSIVFITASALCLLTAATLKAVDPLAHLIGEEPLVTVMFSFGTLFFWCAGIIFVKTLSAFYARQVQYFYRSERKSLPFPLKFVIICNFLGCLSPIGCVIAPSASTGFILSHYFLLAFLNIALGGYWMGFFSESFLRALTEVDSFGKTDGVRRQGSETDLGRVIGWVRFMKNQGTQMALMNFTIALLMAWPYLLRKASYQLAIAAITAPFAAFGCLSVLNDRIKKNKANSSAKDGSINGAGDSRFDGSNNVGSTFASDKIAQIVPRRDSEESQEV